MRNIPGIVLSIDFEAFDTAFLKFIDSTLKNDKFGSSIRKWLKRFQNGEEASVIQNGFISEKFKLKQGCRQGDPLSPYHFILCAEILGQMLRNNKDITGIRRDDKIYKLSQYADDTQIFQDGTEKSLRVIEISKCIYKLSGLKINVEKKLVQY